MLMMVRFLFLPSLLFCVTLAAVNEDGHLCLEEERSALFEFKQSFVADSNSEIVFSSWKLGEGENGDCCRSWNGVECDIQSGHVTGLDLSSNSLVGSLSSNSSIFRLLHLQKLNLAYNNFNYSQIPASIGNLSNLTSLNLTQSTFAGQVPAEVLQLSSLSSLDLSENNFLELKKPDFVSLVHNLPNLEHLNLNFMDMPGSVVPRILLNRSSLQSLRLQNCRLHGKFPSGVFRLPNLRILDLSYNTDLSCSLPDDIRSPLEKLYLVRSNLSGQIPFSLGKLTNLTGLYLPYNNLVGEIPSSIGNLTRLVALSLDENHLTGSIPPGIFALPELESLDLAKNQLTGLIPSLTVKESLMTGLDLSNNDLQGPIPDFIFRLKSLQSLSLGSNNLTGTVRLDKFLALENLTSLDLSFNRLSLLYESTMNLTSLNFQQLFLSSCNLTRFPEFLQQQQGLRFLDLSSNDIHGKIPDWLLNISSGSLLLLNLSNNFLTGFESHPVEFLSASLTTLDLSSNLLEGSLPIPPVSMNHYIASRNKLSGDISATICELTYLQTLDLSFNNFTGMVPECLGSFSSSLTILSLRHNNFRGTIPQNFTSECYLQMIDLSENQLEGKLPRSLANCAQLQFLAAASNRVNDTFPDWLGSLSELSVLILRANSFHSAIPEPETDSGFSKLQIVDISYNFFTGKLPEKYFSSWQAMKLVNHVEELGYMKQYLFSLTHTSQFYAFSLTMQNKGSETSYSKILDILVFVDFSSNKFEGEIPELIGSLKGVHSLNLSSNALTGNIPRSLKNLKDLESLDLSSNDLSGEIPQELVQLSFLAVFNVSHNQLTGRVPEGQQFDTFQDSYYGNLGLCGELLSRKCGSSAETLPDESEEESESWFELGWKIIIAGYGGGLVVGLVGGNILFSRSPDWFLGIFLRKKKKNKTTKSRKGSQF